MANLYEKLSSVRRLIGGTPLWMFPDKVFPDKSTGSRVFAKLESTNYSGSVKDRSAYAVLHAAILRDEVRSDSIVVESSSGNMATALACLCNMLSIPFVAVIDSNITPQREAFLRLNCHKVIKVEQPALNGGFLGARLQIVKELCAHDPRYFWSNQYANSDIVAAHRTWLGREICDEVPDLRYIFVGVSSAGTIAGISQAIRAAHPEAKVIGVDAIGSVIFGGSAKSRYIPGIGAGIRPVFLDVAHIDDVVMISESESVDACHDLLAHYGLFVGGSSGTIFAAMQHYLRNRPLKGSAVMVFPDGGGPYVDTVYNKEWLRQRGLGRANNTLSVPAPPSPIAAQSSPSLSIVAT